ncbi:lanthionine synthetase LanC family protein [Belliella marina]|uniref:Lanthionine synthetase LanC family protein n=1 Tax=Belliella marina TaxID=1644146 RepID=A0ABW4VFA6_9BACT
MNSNLDNQINKGKGFFTDEAKNMEILIHEIEDALGRNKNQFPNFSIQDGWLGQALFYCYYARFTDNDNWFGKVEDAMNKSLEVVDYAYYKRIYPTDSYDHNLASLGKFYSLCTQNGFLDMDYCSYLKPISETLIELCRNKIRHKDFSYFSGALAAGHYFLFQECNNEVSKTIIEEIVIGIKESAIADEKGGLYWKSPKLYNRVYLGLTHGSAMIVSFLAAVYEHGILKEVCAKLMHGALLHIISIKRDYGTRLFPYYIGEDSNKSQFSLCYGDLGVAFGILRGGAILQDHEILKEGKLVMDACMKKKHEDHQTFDASITYGAVGIAHVFEKLSRLFPEEKAYEQSYRYWIHQVPKYRTHNKENTAGFNSFISNYSPHFDYSFSWGISGIGVSLMHYLRKDGIPSLDGFTCVI